MIDGPQIPLQSLGHIIHPDQHLLQLLHRCMNMIQILPHGPNLARARTTPPASRDDRKHALARRDPTRCDLEARLDILVRETEGGGKEGREIRAEVVVREIGDAKGGAGEVVCELGACDEAGSGGDGRDVGVVFLYPRVCGLMSGERGGERRRTKRGGPVARLKAALSSGLTSCCRSWNIPNAIRITIRHRSGFVSSAAKANSSALFRRSIAHSLLNSCVKATRLSKCSLEDSCSIRCR